MFGSRREPELFDGREVIWHERSTGSPLSGVLPQLAELVRLHPGVDLMIGYWEYGNQLVVTAPTNQKP